MLDDMNVVALVKGDEYYVFIYDDISVPDVLCELGVFASNSELSFTWFDAAVLAERVRTEAKKSFNFKIE